MDLRLQYLEKETGRVGARPVNGYDVLIRLLEVSEPKVEH